MGKHFQAWPLLAALAVLAVPARGQDMPGAPPADAPAAVPPPAPEGRAPADFGGFSFSSQPVTDVKVEAEHFEGTAEALGTVRASGNVRAVLTQAPEPGGQPTVTVITADALTADLGEKVLTADGRVTVVSGARTARGEHLEYAWGAQTGHVTSVELRQYGLAFRAESLTAAPGRQTIVGAEFSPCGLDDPDFAVLARRVTIVPDKRIVAHGVTLELFQRRLITLRRLEYRLRNGRAQARQGLPVPRPGYSRVSGFSVAQPLPAGENMDLVVEPTTRVGIRGRFAWEPEGKVTPYTEVEWRREQGVRARDPVLVSSLPRVGLHVGRNQELDINAGYYTERPTGTREARADINWRQRLLDRGTRPGLSLSVNARVSTYSNGDFYRTAGLEASVGRGNRDVFEEVGIRVNGLKGRTPFLWDEVQMQTELFGAKRIAWGNYRLEAAVRYDAERREMYDVQVGVARRFECLEPEIRYSTRRRFILLSIRVPGLE